VAFQLRDDLLGVYGDPAVTGKPAGDDLREGKRTVLVAMALERASSVQSDLVRRELGSPTADVDAVRSVLMDTGAVDRVEELISVRTEQALAALDGSAVTPSAQQALTDLAVAATARQS
jgi:geranylgeranyl diphosphate synthase type I